LIDLLFAAHLWILKEGFMFEDKHFGLTLLPLKEIKTLLFYSGVRNLHPWAKSPVRLCQLSTFNLLWLVQSCYMQTILC